MTHLDILILALPTDRARAEMVLDGLHEAKVAGVHPTRIETPATHSTDWVETARIGRAARCVMFCWSQDTAAPEAGPLRALGAELAARGTALSVELDYGSAPSELTGVTTYPAYGWRCRPGAALRFLFGDIHRAQIAVGAQRKVAGQDPPPPAAFWQLLRGRGWAAIVGFFALLGTASLLWGLWNDNALARKTNPTFAAEFAKARDTRDCPAMHVFSDRHPGSPWANEVTEFLSNCQVRDVPEPRTTVTSLPVYGATRAEAEQNARNLCDRHAANILGKTVAVRLTKFVPSGDAEAECSVEHRMAVPREIYVVRK